MDAFMDILSYVVVVGAIVFLVWSQLAIVLVAIMFWIPGSLERLRAGVRGLLILGACLGFIGFVYLPRFELESIWSQLYFWCIVAMTVDLACVFQHVDRLRRENDALDDERSSLQADVRKLKQQKSQLRKKWLDERRRTTVERLKAKRRTA